MKVFSKKIMADFKKDEKFEPVSGVLSRWSTYLSFTEKPNRNHRLYDKGFWEDIVNQPMFKEMVATKTLFGELDHPFIEERMGTINPDRVSHSIVNVEVDDLGVKGVVEVLDTPCGRILDTFLKYGSKIGVSTRGMGEEYPRPGDGYLVPDRASYEFKTWDAVLTPAFEECRRGHIKDSLGKTKSVLFDGMQNMTRDEQRSVLSTLGFVRGATREVRAGSDLLESYRNAGLALQKLVDSLTLRLSTSDRVNEKYREEANFLNDQLALLNRRQVELERADALNDSLRASNAELRSLVRSLRSERHTLRSENKTLADAVRGVRKENVELKKRATALYDKMNNVSERHLPAPAESGGEDSGADVTNLIRQRGKNT